MYTVIDKNWLHHLQQESKNTKIIRIISPFITYNMVKHLIKAKGTAEIEIITRYNLNDFRNQVSSTLALKTLVHAGVKIRGIKGLHSKVYIFDETSVIISSANLTNGGFFSNHEFGIKSFDGLIIKESLAYFHSLFKLDPDNLNLVTIVGWEKDVESQNAKNPPPSALPDHGASPIKGKDKHKQFFIKFFGSGEDRAKLTYPVSNMIKDSHCHFAITFSGKRGRPRKYKDGDIVYLARILNGKDYAIFGRAIAIQHNDQRDVASPEDLAQLSWKKYWPVYIRIKEPVFIEGIMGNCPKMSHLIGDLDVEAFSWTNRRTLNGETGINPWDSLRRQADVELTEIAAEWLAQKFDAAIANHGTVPGLFIDGLYKSVVNE